MRRVSNTKASPHIQRSSSGRCEKPTPTRQRPLPRSEPWLAAAWAEITCAVVLAGFTGTLIGWYVAFFAILY